MASAKQELMMKAGAGTTINEYSFNASSWLIDAFFLTMLLVQGLVWQNPLERTAMFSLATLV